MSSVEQQLVEEIVEKLIEDIFNKLVEGRLGMVEDRPWTERRGGGDYEGGEGFSRP